MSQHYSDPGRQSQRYALPDLEVFYAKRGDLLLPGYAAHSPPEESDAEPSPPGWYWWICYPGCLPDSDPNGPFASEADALADARELNSSEGD